MGGICTLQPKFGPKFWLQIPTLKRQNPAFLQQLQQLSLSVPDPLFRLICEEAAEGGDLVAVIHVPLPKWMTVDLNVQIQFLLLLRNPSVFVVVRPIELVVLPCDVIRFIQLGDFDNPV